MNFYLVCWTIDYDMPEDHALFDNEEAAIAYSKSMPGHYGAWIEEIELNHAS